MKPHIRAYVIGPPGANEDIFYTLPTALELPWSFEYAHIERDRFTVELIGDVHREHRIRNAIVVITSRSLDRYCRLALAHAWREGVRHFILVLACKFDQQPGDTSELEAELRVLLDALGDGGAAPCIRTALTRCAGRTTPGMRTAMEQLLAEIERVFVAGESAVIEAPLPASFAREEAILDAMRPLVRAQTMFDRKACTLEETAEVHGGSFGSHYGGWPYIERGEDWPVCPHCRQAIECLMQIDTRDVLHAAPPKHRLFVVYRCDRCYKGDLLVRHYADPTVAARMPLDQDYPIAEDNYRLVMERLAHTTPDYELVEANFPEAVAALAEPGVEWHHNYGAAEVAMGTSSLRIPDHAGGYECTQAPRYPKCVCDEPLVIVFSKQWGDWWYTVWACPEHPEITDVGFSR